MQFRFMGVITAAGTVRAKNGNNLRVLFPLYYIICKLRRKQHGFQYAEIGSVHGTVVVQICRTARWKLQRVQQILLKCYGIGCCQRAVAVDVAAHYGLPRLIRFAGNSV